MNVKRLALSLALLLLIPLAAGGSQASTPLGPGFTYQGQLTDDTGRPLAGPCDLRFDLWDDLDAGSHVAGPLDRSGVVLDHGRFTVTLDFGSVFDGRALWLAVAVRCGADPGYTALSPRQPLTAAPYAAYALNADTVDGRHAGNLARTTYGTLPYGGGSVSIEIPHWTPFTLSLGAGWPDYGGVAFVEGMENDGCVAVTFMAYNGNGTSQTGGAECCEYDTTTLLTFGSGSHIYTVRCPGETDAPHNLVLTAAVGAVELRYTVTY